MFSKKESTAASIDRNTTSTSSSGAHADTSENKNHLLNILLEAAADDKKDAARIIFGLGAGDEGLVLEGLRNILTNQGAEGVRNVNAEFNMILGMTRNNKPEDYSINLFATVVWSDFVEAAKIFLECGVNINASNISKVNGAGHYFKDATPLALACEKGSLQMVQLLLRNHAGLNSSQESRSTVFDNACLKGRVDILQELLHLEDFAQYCNIRSVLHHARMASWLYPQHSKAFEDICSRLRPLKAQQVPIVEFSCKTSDVRSTHDEKILVENYYTLFGQTLEPSVSPRSKEQVINIAIAQIYILFSSIRNVLPYLQFINAEFSRYYREKTGNEFPPLDSDTYSFKTIDGLRFPIPNAPYTGLDKSKSLPEFLILLLNKYNLGKNAYKWIGLVPVSTAKQMFAEGDFITEDTIGLPLFHGKLSHVLQYAVILHALEDGSISREYVEDGKKGRITVEDILKKLGAHLSLRENVVDVRYPETVSFSDPFRLISILMEKGAELKLKSLSDYLIDSFCKGIMKRLAACKKIFNLDEVDMTLFAEQSNDLMVELFTDTPETMNYEQELVIGKTKKTGNHSAFFKTSDRYAVVEKHYQPYSQFSPKTFRS